MKPLLPNSVASKVLCAGYVFRRASTRWSVMQNLVAVASAGFLTLGCTTFAADRYSVSTDTHMELKAAAEAREELIAVDEFTASKPGITGITCRVWSLIKTPDGGTFESFIRQALIDELRFAEIYSLEAAVRLKGNLDRIESGSMSGIWRLALTVSDTAGRSFSVREDYDYAVGIDPTNACSQTARAFMPAAQNLIQKVISHPQFQVMITD